ncbi:hypothetical protein METUNv1_04028 [Methyloversatilis universalis FAM5]|uniref:Uncharacterized protein n=1 Tax=Methyloversatilis universalis (strain ATCC BAA-1314 / DSM 25237 / JCM 13912 / CCUG 52030 / FAM5) TaxID=1000565 RepID=F5RI78_METUF|nr:hypothetical protein [Methyloversatilis universalis]EGK70060.1 hypothetical protein METUNv1_04028 [Methyloversatilis universalis FAM5]
MLTRDKLDIYRRFNGDLDDRTRRAPDTRALISDEEWAMLDELHMQIRIAHAGQCSATFRTALDARLAACCTPEVRAALLNEASG